MVTARDIQRVEEKEVKECLAELQEAHKLIGTSLRIEEKVFLKKNLLRMRPYFEEIHKLLWNAKGRLNNLCEQLRWERGTLSLSPFSGKLGYIRNIAEEAKLKTSIAWSNIESIVGASWENVNDREVKEFINKMLSNARESVDAAIKETADVVKLVINFNRLYGK